MISPCVSFNSIPDRRSRTPSLSGYSPSPCDSISLVDADLSESPPTSPRKSFSRINHLKSSENSPTMSPVNHYLDRFHNFERRASDSYCLTKYANDFNRINLADEIKKLSDKLLKLETVQNRLNNNNNEEFAFNSEEEYKNNNFMLTTTAKTLRKYSRSESQTDFGSEEANSSAFYSGPTSTKSSHFENFYEKMTTKEEFGMPRRKFKFSNRDVPIQKAPSSPEFENASDTSSTLSSAGHSNPSTPDVLSDTLDHAKNLLQILDFCPKPGIRKTSLTMNWTEVESLSQRTIKSLSSFLQTPRMPEPKSKTTTP